MSNGKGGRPQTWLDEYDFVKKFHLLIVKPYRCVCGEDNYRFSLVRDSVYARCNQCGYLRYFNANTNLWGPFENAHRKEGYKHVYTYLDKTFDSITYCNECKSTNLYEDIERGEIVCRNCGLVIFP